MALFAVSAPADDAAGGTDVRLQPIVEKIETKRITATDRYNFIDIPFPKCFSPNERKIGNLDRGCAREELRSICEVIISYVGKANRLLQFRRHGY
jgi:hypothetical protein